MTASRSNTWKGVSGVLSSPDVSLDPKDMDKIIFQIMQRGGAAHGADIKELDDNEIYSIEYGEKPRMIFTRITLGDLKYVYLLEDDPEHKKRDKDGRRSIYLRLKHAVDDHLAKPYVREHIWQQLAQFNFSQTSATSSAQSKENLLFPKHAKTIIYKGKKENLSYEQILAYLSETPVVFVGGPGTGKTLLEIIWLKLQAEKGLSAIYITKNISLLKEQEEEFRKAYPTIPVRFATYRQLLEEMQAQKPESERKTIITRGEFVNLLKQQMIAYKNTKLKDKDFPLSFEECERLLRIRSGFTAEKFLELGKKKVDFGGAENVELRQIINEIYKNITDKLEKNKQLHEDYAELKLPKRFGAVVYDESHDASLCQMNSIINNVAEDYNWVIAYNNSQKSYDLLDNKEEYIKAFSNDIYNSTGKNLSFVHLTEERRSSKEICDLINRGDLLINCTSHSKEVYLTSKSEMMGDVQFLEYDDANIKELKKYLTESNDFVIITHENFKEKACEAFGTGNVFTPLEFKGLDKQNVILYRFFEDKKFKPVLDRLNQIVKDLELNKAELNIESLFEQLKTQEVLDITFLKDFLISVSRGIHGLYFYGLYPHPFIDMLKFIANGKKLGVALNKMNVKYTHNTAADCKKWVEKLLNYAEDNEALLMQAKAKFKEYLELEKKEMASQSAQTSSSSSSSSSSVSSSTTETEKQKYQVTNEELERAFAEFLKSRIVVKIIEQKSPDEKEEKKSEDVNNSVVSPKAKKKKKKKKNTPIEQAPQIESVVKELKKEDVIIEEASQQVESPVLNVSANSILTTDQLEFVFKNFAENVHLLFANKEHFLKYLLETSISYKNKSKSLFEHIAANNNKMEIFIKHLKTVKHSSSLFFPSTILNASKKIQAGLKELIMKTNNTIKLANFALHDAVENNQFSMVKYLLTNYKDQLNIHDGLMFAASIGLPKIITLFLDLGADIESKNADYDTSLILALKNNRYDAVELLINKGANVKLSRALGIAIENENEKLVELLLKKSNKIIIANVTISDLGQLIINGKKSAVRILTLFKKIDPTFVNLKNEDGDTLLHDACIGNKLPVVEFLIEAKAEINARDCENKTPLYLAAEGGYTAIVKYLLKNNADIDLLGVTIDSSIENGTNEISYEAKSHYNRLQSISPDADMQCSPLGIATIMGHMDVIKTICDMKNTEVMKNHLHLTQCYFLALNVNTPNEEIIRYFGAKILSAPLTIVDGKIACDDIYRRRSSVIKNILNDGIFRLYDLIFHEKTDCLQVFNFPLEIKDASVIFLGVYIVNNPIAWKNFLTFIQGEVNHISNVLNFFPDDLETRDNTIINLMKHIITKAKSENFDILSIVLEDAIKRNATGLMKFLLKNFQQILPAGCLSCALKYKNLEMLKLLIEVYNAPVNYSNIQKVTILMLAAQVGDLDIIKYLLSKGAKAELKDQNGMTVLHYASKHGNLNIVKFFVEQYDPAHNINQADALGKTPLYHAIEYKNSHVIKYFLSKNANVNYKVQYSEKEKDEGIKQLVKFLCSQINLQQNQITAITFTPLHIALCKLQTEIMALLIKERAKLNEEICNYNYIEFALFTTAFEIIPILQREISKVHPEIGVAMESKHKKDLLTIIENDNDNDNDKLTLNYMGHSLLCFATIFGYEDIVIKLLASGFDPNQLDNGKTAINYAGINGNLTILKLLVEKNGDLFHQHFLNMSVLHDAISNNYIDMVQYWIDQKGSLDIHCLTTNDRLIEIFLNQTNVDLGKADELLSLFSLADEGPEDFVEHADQAVQIFKCTPLHLAIILGHKEIVSLLITNGAKLDDNFNYLKIAKLCERTEIVELLQEAINKKSNIDSAPKIAIEVTTIVSSVREAFVNQLSINNHANIAANVVADETTEQYFNPNNSTS